MSPLIIGIISILGLLTAAFSAVFGVAGGMMLFVILSLFLNAVIAVPVHAFTQLISNFSRVWVSFRLIDWKVVKEYMLLIIPGAFLGSQLYKYFNADYLEIMVGCVIIAVLYFPFKDKVEKFKGMFLILGFVSGFLGMIIGVVGPLISPFFSIAGIKKEKMVATKAACQFFVQFVKIPAFGLLLQFDFTPYLFLILFLILATITGTVIGNRFIHKISDKKYFMIERFVLTALSLILITKSAIRILDISI